MNILTLTFLLAAASSALTAGAQKTVYNHVFAPSEGLVNRTETQYREEICLNGYWDFQPVATPRISSTARAKPRADETR